MPLLERMEIKSPSVDDLFIVNVFNRAAFSPLIVTVLEPEVISPSSSKVVPSPASALIVYKEGAVEVCAEFSIILLSTVDIPRADIKSPST